MHSSCVSSCLLNLLLFLTDLGVSAPLDYICFPYNKEAKCSREEILSEFCSL